MNIPTRRFSLAVVAVAVLVAAAACGVPGSGPATRVEHVPHDEGAKGSIEDRPLEPSQNAVDTVDSFLGAAAGEWGGRDDRLDKFTAGGVDWTDPAEGIELIRPTGEGIDVTDEGSSVRKEVTVHAQIVGKLTQNGQVKGWSGSDTFTETYQLRRDAPGDVWKLDSPPRQVVLQDDDFAERYEPSPLYFPASSDSDGALVPDLRWMPIAVEDAEVRYSQLTDWLVSGPTEWLSSTVASGFPDGTARKSVVVDGESDLVKVEISAEAASQPAKATRQMSAQLAWTLGLHGDQELSLRVDGQERLRSKASEWSSRNHAPAEDVETEDLAYFVRDAKVAATDPDAPFVGVEAEGMKAVAIEPRGDRMAAVATGAGGDRLLVGDDSDLEEVEGFAEPDVTDPQWLDEDTLLVLASGKPTTVDIESGQTRRLEIDSDHGAASAIALAPDSRRLAYVADGHVWVAMVLPDDGGAVKLGETRRVGDRLADVTDVAFSRETHIMAIGTVSGGSGWLWEVSLDDAFQMPMLSDDNTTRAVALAVRCAAAGDHTNREGQPTLLEIDGVINRLYSTVSPVTVRDSDGGLSNATGSGPFTAP